jgi:hypothetical protein
MRRVLPLAILAGVALTVSAPTVRAQFGQPGAYRPPTVSPYINLLRGDQPQYLNYYGLVRPQLQFQNGIQSLQAQTSLQGNALSSEAALTNGLLLTGHPVYFRNTGVYFARTFTGAGGMGAGSYAGGATGLARGGSTAGSTGAGSFGGAGSLTGGGSYGGAGRGYGR